MLYPPSGSTRRSGGNPGRDHGDGGYRGDFDRDYARILHSPAFRRLTGKTQLFPSDENDFFRNRLTHSIEVAQIASAIALRINATHKYYKRNKISPRLCELAALAHDIGHPPFGHNGEAALHHLMNGSGGFEGNAQTIRIVSKLEKKDFLGDDEKALIMLKDDGAVVDKRLGLDLCARSLAAMLKYDHLIPPSKSSVDTVIKGYYYDDTDVIEFVKAAVGEPETGVEFRTIECSIMDLADDIAYSTYDLEDAFKAGFLNPLKMISADTSFKEDVAAAVMKRAARYYPKLSSRWKRLSAADVDGVLRDVFSNILDVSTEKLDAAPTLEEQITMVAAHVQNNSQLWAENGYFRTALTSSLVGRFVDGIKVEECGANPVFWNAQLKFDDFICVEVLKVFAYNSLIRSSFLRLSEYRGRDILTSIFNAIMDGTGTHMMPTDFRRMTEAVGDSSVKHRLVSDFIGCMTDRYAFEFYRRLVGTDSPSIFKPY